MEYNGRQRVSWTIAGPDSSGREESPDTSLRQQMVGVRGGGATLRPQASGQRAW